MKIKSDFYGDVKRENEELKLKTSFSLSPYLFTSVSIKKKPRGDLSSYVTGAYSM